MNAPSKSPPRRRIFLTFFVTCALLTSAYSQNVIDRRAVVLRHSVKIAVPDSLSSLTVGNGGFAFTADVTGLQSFPEYYTNGVPLGTQSEWGWHSFPNNAGYREEETLREYAFGGKKISYAVQQKEPKRSNAASNYFRVNQHRLQLGNIGLDIIRRDGTRASISDLEDIDQTLDLWKGEITSHFSVEGLPVTVTTYAHHTKDAIAAKIVSPLLQEGRIKVRIRFPYPTGAFGDEGVNYSFPERHESTIIGSGIHSTTIQHRLDTTRYYVHVTWGNQASVAKQGQHYFTLTPQHAADFEFAILFSQSTEGMAPTFMETRDSSMEGWEQFWMSGGAIDFAGSTDPRAAELERRVILSEYLTRAQCAGNFPPQETGLTCNSWYGKPHLEMLWWHAAHYALWNRTELLENMLTWYFSAASQARHIAERQGFDGVRWQKMTDNEGREVPSTVGAFLLWQQPHLIYFAELVYRNRKDRATLERYKELVFATADFMASFPTYDKKNDRFNLGPGLIPAQECFKPEATFNPTYELAYWHWGLRTAQEWRRRLGLPPKKEWDNVLNKLAPLPRRDGVYLATESTPDCYDADSQYTIDHPAVLAALSTLPPANHLDTAVMHRTFDLVQEVWHWDHTWGWDFPMTAMTATRLALPSEAVNALFRNNTTNTYLRNGHNYQDTRLRIYLPGNGGILAAVAMMCAGFDGCKTQSPGFPKDGTWKVRWEGLREMP
jgi:hypothetical protein